MLTTLVTDSADGRGGPRARRRRRAGADGRAVSRETAVLAIDLGTTEVKAGLVGARRPAARHRPGRATRRTPTPPPAARSRIPRRGGARSAWPSASCVRLDVGEVCAIGIDGHGPTLVAVDAARPRDPSRDHLAGHPLDRGGRRSSPPRRGSRAGAWPGCRPRSGSSGNEPAAAAATRWYLATWDALALRLTGRATTSLVEGQPFPDAAALASVGLPAAKVPAGRSRGHGRRRSCSPTPRRGPRPAVPASRSSPASSTPGRASTAPGMTAAPATRWTPAARRAGSGSTGTGRWTFPARSRRSRRCPACTRSAGRWPRRAGRSTGSGSTSSAAASTTERLLEEAGTIAPGADGVVFLPYLAGERSPLWDPAARGAFAGLDARPRARPPDPRDPRGVGVRDPPRRRVDPRGRRRGPDDARLRRPGPERDVEPDQGRRDRVHGRGAGRPRDGGGGRGDGRARPRSARGRTCRPRSGG